MLLTGCPAPGLLQTGLIRDWWLGPRSAAGSSPLHSLHPGLQAPLWCCACWRAGHFCGRSSCAIGVGHQQGAPGAPSGGPAKDASQAAVCTAASVALAPPRAAPAGHPAAERVGGLPGRSWRRTHPGMSTTSFNAFGLLDGGSGAFEPVRGRKSRKKAQGRGAQRLQPRWAIARGLGACLGCQKPAPARAQAAAARRAHNQRPPSRPLPSHHSWSTPRSATASCPPARPPASPGRASPRARALRCRTRCSRPARPPALRRTGPASGCAGSSRCVPAFHLCSRACAPARASRSLCRQCAPQQGLTSGLPLQLGQAGSGQAPGLQQALLQSLALEHSAVACCCSPSLEPSLAAMLEAVLGGERAGRRAGAPSRAARRSWA